MNCFTALLLHISGRQSSSVIQSIRNRKADQYSCLNHLRGKLKMETVLKYLPVIVFYIKCFVSYFTFARTNAKSNEYLTRLRHPEFRTYWGHKILLAALDFTTKGTFYLIALFIWIFPGSQDLLLNILIL